VTLKPSVYTDSIRVEHAREAGLNKLRFTWSISQVFSSGCPGNANAGVSD
jgi:hypothetical protein